jgi:hypothetical protein
VAHASGSCALAQMCHARHVQGAIHVHAHLLLHNTMEICNGQAELLALPCINVVRGLMFAQWPLHSALVCCSLPMAVSGISVVSASAELQLLTSESRARPCHLSVCLHMLQKKRSWWPYAFHRQMSSQ